MTWIRFIQLIIRLLAGGGVLFAVQHEARAAQAVGDFSLQNIIALLTWFAGAAAAWAATSGTIWQRVLKFLDWYKHNPPPLNSLLRARDSFVRQISLRTDLPVEVRCKAICAVDDACCHAAVPHTTVGEAALRGTH